jgi:cytochrome P450
MKTVLAGVEANLFVNRWAKTCLSARPFRQKQLETLAVEKYLVAMDGEAHYRLRKAQKRGYGRSVLDDRYDELAAIVHRHTIRWQPGQSVSVRRFMQEVIVDQLGTAILNYPTPDSWQAICRYIQGMMATSFARQPLGEERQRTYQEARSQVMTLVDEIIAAHRNRPPEGHRPDLVDDLLAATAQEENLLTEQELRIAVLTAYIGGINPVAHVCTFMLHALLSHPHILAQVVDEIDATFTGQPLSAQLLAQMERLRATMLEALRLYPFAPTQQMTAVKAFEFAGYLVEAGTTITIAAAVPHFLPEFYPDPFKFDIDRYSAGRTENRPSGAYVPYGVGPHICLGAGFAEVQMMLTMSTLLSSVQLEIDPESPKPVVGDRRRNSFTARVVKQRK